MGHTGNARSEVIDFVPPEVSTVLDVGCSDGRFAELLRLQRAGVVVDGVESDADAAARGAHHFRDLVIGLFPDDLPSANVYDCITFLDCLEHMDTPWVALKAARDLLSSTGCVVASIPNVRHIRVIETLLLRKDWLWEDQNIFDRTHVRWFTKKSMIRMFEDADYVVSHIEPINIWTNPKTRAAKMVLGSDVAATQFVVVARPR